jgi:hypothetical protein
VAHLFEGEPDARQSDDPRLPVSRFRPRYRALSAEEQALHDSIKATATKLEKLYDQTRIHCLGARPTTADDHYHALAMTALEQSVMWAVKALTANA